MESSSTPEEIEPRHTCLKLEVPDGPIFVKGTWYPSHFSLFITDGCDAWLCNASEEDVRERASQWDQSVSEYIEFAEKYLGFQQPGSVYNFADAGNGHRRLSWTFEKEGTKLEWRWRCKPSPNSQKTTVDILDFLMHANIRLSEEVVRKTKSVERLREEAQKCLEQSEKLSIEKQEFESEVYAKFVNVLNSKKAKLRELHDQLSNREAAATHPRKRRFLLMRPSHMSAEMMSTAMKGLIKMFPKHQKMPYRVKPVVGKEIRAPKLNVGFLVILGKLLNSTVHPAVYLMSCWASIHGLLNSEQGSLPV